MSAGVDVGTFKIPASNFRIGIVDPRHYEDIFSGNTLFWSEKGGCALGIGMSKGCEEAGTAFNFFTFDRNPMIEWSDVDDDIQHNTIGTVAKGAKVEVAKLPYLAHSETRKRPTLLMFEVTGHVMLAIYFNGTKRGSTLHILNPWPIGNTQQLLDVYTLFGKALGYLGAKNVEIIDVAGDVEKYTQSLAKTGNVSIINLQDNERVGFCTLWVGILASAVLRAKAPDGSHPMTFLDRQVKSGADPIGTYQLNQALLDFYFNVYWTLMDRRNAIIKDAKKVFGEDKCFPASAAHAVATMLKESVSGGKRMGGRRTYRRKSKWKRQSQRSSSTRRRIRRITRKRGNAF